MSQINQNSPQESPRPRFFLNFSFYSPIDSPLFLLIFSISKVLPLFPLRFVGVEFDDELSAKHELELIPSTITDIDEELGEC